MRKVIIPMSYSTSNTQHIANMEAMAVTFRLVGLYKIFIFKTTLKC